MTDVVRGGYADKLAAMGGEPIQPEPWDWLSYGSAGLKAPFDLFSRMVTRGQVGVLTPAEQAAIRGVKRDVMPDAMVNAFDRGLEYMGHLGAAMPAGVAIRAGQAPQTMRNAPPILSDAVMRQQMAADRAAILAREAERAAAMRPQSLESAVEIVRRPAGPATGPVPPPPSIPRAMQPLPPEPQITPMASPSAGSPATMAQNAFEPLAGRSVSASAVPPPPPGPNWPSILADLESKMRGEGLFSAGSIPEPVTINLINQVAREYGVTPRMLSERALMNNVSVSAPPSRLPVALPEPPPANAFAAAEQAGQMRLPFRPTAADKRMFWGDVQAVLNHGGSINDILAANAAQSAGITPGMAKQRLGRARNTGMDGPELAEFIRRGIESGNWKLAVPPVAASGLYDSDQR